MTVNNLDSMPQVAKNIVQTDQHQPSSGKAQKAAYARTFWEAVNWGFLDAFSQTDKNEQCSSLKAKIMGPLVGREELHYSTEK